MSSLDNAVIVLVQPQQPGNVGAVARAMKNMALQSLVLVDPPAYDPERARWMAPGCADILAKARIVKTLDEALEGCHFAVAATARHRKGSQQVIQPSELARLVLEQPDRTVAVVFGREDFGLDRASVDRCHSVLRIQTPEHASLNLGQAVLIVAHHLFEAAQVEGLAASGRTLGGRCTKLTAQLDQRDGPYARADLKQLEPTVHALIGLLDRVGYTRSTAPEKVALTARSAFQNAGLSVKEVGALRGMVERLHWALDHPHTDWAATRKKTPATD